MAGQPIKNKLRHDIESAEGGWDAIWDRVACGEGLEVIGKSFGLSRGPLTRLIYEDEERVRCYKRALEMRGEHYADEALQIVDAVPEAKEPRDEIMRSKTRSDTRKWFASKLNRPMFGEDQPQVNVGMSFGEIHVAVLKAGNARRAELEKLPEGTWCRTHTEILPCHRCNDDSDAERVGAGFDRVGLRRSCAMHRREAPCPVCADVASGRRALPAVSVETTAKEVEQAPNKPLGSWGGSDYGAGDYGRHATGDN